MLIPINHVFSVWHHKNSVVKTIHVPEDKILYFEEVKEKLVEYDVLLKVYLKGCSCKRQIEILSCWESADHLFNRLKNIIKLSGKNFKIATKNKSEIYVNAKRITKVEPLSEKESEVFVDGYPAFIVEKDAEELSLEINYVLTER